MYWSIGSNWNNNCLYSGCFVGKSCTKDFGLVENGCAVGKPGPSDAWTRDDTVQTLSTVHTQRGHRDEMFGTSYVSVT